MEFESQGAQLMNVLWPYCTQDVGLSIESIVIFPVHIKEGCPGQPGLERQQQKDIKSLEL